MNCLKFILCVLFLVFGTVRGWASAAATLTNHNLVYFQIDALPTAIPTNVIMLTGNLTNWQKLLTNVICNPCLIINPTDTYVPYRINSSEFGDSWWHYLVDGMVIDTNIFFAPGVTNRLYRQGQSLNYQGSNSPSLLVRDLNNKTISLGLNSVSSIGAFLTSMNQVQWGNTSDTLYMQSGTIQGNGIVGSLLNFGYNNNPLMVIRSCTNEIYGLIDINLANFSRVAMYQRTTNSPFVFDQQTGGIAGYPRGFEFDTNGVKLYRIPTTNWVDSMVPQTAVRVGATAPTTAAFNGGPATTLMFQNNRDDTVEFSVQLNHNYKQGTDISPHVHWCETAATGAGTNVVWELTYTWQNVNGVFGAYNTLYTTNYVTTTNWFHQLSEFPEISGSGKTVSSILVCQLRRLANSATADNYDQNVAFLGCDIHYQVDSPGSDSELSKSF